MSVVTTAITAILKQFQATPPPAFVKAIVEIYVTCGGAHPYYQCLAADGNTFLEYRDNIQAYVAAVAGNNNQGNAGYRPPGVANQTRPLEKLIELANTLLNENCSAVILKKLPEKLGGPGKFLIPCGFSELKCKALADLGIARDVFVSVRKFTFPADFVIVDYESDPRIPLILGRPFLQTARALIDVHGEEMILRDGNERLILNMRHDTSSYSNEPHQESINMIDVYNVSNEEILEDLFATNHPSGNPTSSLTSLTNLTSPKVNDDIFDPEEDIIENLLNLDKTKDLPPYHDNPLSGNPTPISEPETNNPSSPLPPFHNSLSGSTTSSSPSLSISETSDYFLKEFIDELTHIIFPPGNDDLPFDAESDFREIEYFLNHVPIKEMDSILEDAKKYIKDPVEIYNIRQRDGESMEEFVRRYKLECRDVKGDPKCMKISGFMHGITNPELIKRLHDKIPKSLDEMIRITTSFLGGEVAASNRKRKKPFSSWKQQEDNQKQNFKKGGYRNQ
ncbi:reverse transcriptase domain-containing protein [Tanacetum coccineum]